MTRRGTGNCLRRSNKVSERAAATGDRHSDGGVGDRQCAATRESDNACHGVRVPLLVPLSVPPHPRPSRPPSLPPSILDPSLCPSLCPSVCPSVPSSPPLHPLPSFPFPPSPFSEALALSAGLPSRWTLLPWPLTSFATAHSRSATHSRICIIVCLCGDAERRGERKEASGLRGRGVGVGWGWGGGGGRVCLCGLIDCADGER
jgi:hypothetical protein